MASPPKKPVYWVIVLGDYGRSPRMQYHTVSLSSNSQNQVHVIAYQGEKPLPEIQQAPNISLHYIPPPSKLVTKLPSILRLLFKALQQLLALLWLTLFVVPRPKAILLQTPPAIPTMLVCYLSSRFHRATLIFDWHNYAYTLMALSLSTNHWLVRLARGYEQYWGRAAHKHFCVTHAMQKHLRDTWGIDATVLHDRPPECFRPTPVATIHSLFQKLHEQRELDAGFDDFLSRSGNAVDQGGEVTVLTRSTGREGEVVRREDRPAVVISSTSWTADEDFGILFKAAQLYDAAASSDASLPPLLFFVTGKGPQKAFYTEQLKGIGFSKVAFRLVWLEMQDYPLMLGSADVGVSLHTSSSGLDLPMKVVDMFGCQLPVLAARYSCIGELVEDGITGLLFGDADELSEHLVRVFKAWKEGKEGVGLLGELRKAVQEKHGLRWKENWDRVAKPIVEG